MAINIINSEDNKYRYDLDAAFKSNNIEFAAEKSGFLHIVSIIEEELKKEGLLSSLFVEFNLVGTILALDTPNKLNSLVYIREGDLHFADRIKKYSDSIIDQFVKEREYTLFFHPEVFIDPQKPQACYSIIENAIEEKSIQYKDDIKKRKNDYYSRLSSDGNVYIGQTSFDRDYYTILDKASEIREKGISVNEELTEFHKLYHYVIGNNVSTAYVSIPILGAQTSNRITIPNIDNIQGQGVVFLFFTIPSGSVGKLEDILEEVTRNLFLKLGDFVRLVSYNYLFNLGLQLQIKAKNEAIKSAKAAIMSRNMSHNLGSHVMAYLKQQLGSVTSIMKEENKVLANLIPDAVKVWDDKKAENVELPFLVGLGRFIGYLQERQDYIATISTDYIPYGAPVNLKDAIYDELNPDLRYLRHKNESNSDARNKPANILLNYIAKSEGLSRENMGEDFQSEKDIRFGYIAYTNDGIKIFGLNVEDDRNTDSFASKNEALTIMRKINFCLPGGLVGRQALFSIIENLIRNAAKHGDTSNVKNLDFTLDVIDGSDIKKRRVRVWDNRVADERWRELYENAVDIDDLYLLTLTDNLLCEQKTVINLKKGLYENYVDIATGQMTAANKGIKEVRISAAWIRGDVNEDSYLKYEDSSISVAGKKAPLVAVEKSAEGHLRYIIGVRKNKIVAIVSEVKDVSGKIVASFDEAVLCKFRELEKQDIDRWSIITDDELKKSKTSYHFILCPDDDKAFRILRPYTSNRLCRWKVNRKSNAVLGRLVSISNNEDTTLNQLLYIYRLFTGLDKKCENVYIDDERAENASKQREREGKSYVHFKKIKFKYNLADINTTKNRIYLYRTHHSTENNYIAFYKSYVEDCKKYKKDLYGCVEGITGDNSSDRLVRREVLDEKWYYTNLYALKKRVAIIDERLFKMIHNVDEKMFVGDSGETIMIEELSKMMDIDDIKEVITDNISMETGMINEIDNAESLEDVVKIIGERLPCKYFNDVLGKTETDKKVVGVSHLTPYYHGKAVDVFTVVKGSEGKMILVGCTKTRFDAKKKKFSNVFEKLATFKRDEDNEFVLEVVSDKYKKYFMDKYDYISIHQGILDKIYENLGVKNNDEGKCKLTASIHQCMMADKSTYGSYLPRFIIHSGRAKPTKNDMPQEQPFIQYAAIENAVKDCKPMLVELLDFAKYEPSNN